MYWKIIFGDQPLGSLASDAIMDDLPTHFVRHGTKVQRKTSHIDLERAFAWVDPGNSKSLTSRSVPLNLEALAIQEERKHSK